MRVDYQTYCQIRLYHGEQRLSYAQIGRELMLDPETVSKYAKLASYPSPVKAQKGSILDPLKDQIVRWLERHPYSATQVYQRLKADHGYVGSFSVVKKYVRRVRPRRHTAYLTLAFAPGEMAQVDWGCAGVIQIEGVPRRLSFFVMVLCYSRRMYLEFTCGEGMEHFLAAHQRGFEYFGGVPAKVLIDNLKTGVITHRFGEGAVFNQRYLDFAAYYGFEPRACNVAKANEKGRVENGVGYVKKNLLAGLELPGSLAAINSAGWHWLESVANVRIHGETRKIPNELFALEKPSLRALPLNSPDTSITREVRVSNRCRVVVDTNRYSVPFRYASQRLTLKLFSDRLCLYHEHNLVANHPRSYARYQDFENPDHVKELLDQRRAARDAKWLSNFYALHPRSEYYYQQLCVRNLNARIHVNKIVALSQIYGNQKVSQAIEDAIQSEAFSSQYIDNILQQRERHVPEPGPLHLTRRSDLLDLELSPADLSLYDTL